MIYLQYSNVFVFFTCQFLNVDFAELGISMCRQSLGKVLESLNDHEMAAECLLAALDLEATSPVQAFHVIPKVLS